MTLLPPFSASPMWNRKSVNLLFNVSISMCQKATIIEVELSLYNVHTNLERDVFKALLAKDAGHNVSTLLLVGKEPARERHSQPASRALMDFVKRHHDLNVIIEDIKEPE